MCVYTWKFFSKQLLQACSTKPKKVENYTKLCVESSKKKLALFVCDESDSSKSSFPTPFVTVNSQWSKEAICVSEMGNLP